MAQVMNKDEWNSILFPFFAGNLAPNWCWFLPPLIWRSAVATDCQVSFSHTEVFLCWSVWFFPFSTSSDTPLKARTIYFPAHDAVNKDNSGDASVFESLKQNSWCSISVWNPRHQRIYGEVKWGGCSYGAELAWVGSDRDLLCSTCFFPISSLLVLLPSRPTMWGRFKWPVKWNPHGLAGVSSGFIIYRHLCPIMSRSPCVTMMMPCVCPCRRVGVCAGHE